MGCIRYNRIISIQKRNGYVHRLEMDQKCKVESRDKAMNLVLEPSSRQRNDGHKYYFWRINTQKFSNQNQWLRNAKDKLKNKQTNKKTNNNENQVSGLMAEEYRYNLSIIKWSKHLLFGA